MAVARGERVESSGASMRVAGLFAGVGGLELGMAAAGHRPGMLCENDPGALAVLRHRFPEARFAEDVRELPSLPRDVDVVTAGFPCQDLSQAGATAGIGGAKSGLVGEVFRLLRRRRVPWLVLENVPFMLHLAKGRAMRVVVDELSALGYRWAYRVVDSRAFGLPQRRRRVFVVASREGNPADVLLADDAEPMRDGKWRPGLAAGFYWTEGNRGVGWAVDAIPTLKGGSGFGIPSAPAVLRADGSVVMPGIEDAEALQGFERGWTQPAEQSGNGRFRWRMVGNAVNVRAARWIGDRLRSPGTFDAKRRGERIDDGRWPSAACDLGDGPRQVRIGEWPRCTSTGGIESQLLSSRSLSVRATSGFVERAERAEQLGKLAFEPGFLAALRRHAKSMVGQQLRLAVRSALVRSGEPPTELPRVPRREPPANLGVEVVGRCRGHA